jgi:hypothetical protein
MEQEQLRQNIEIKRVLYESFKTRPPINETQRTEMATVKNELDELEAKMLKMAMERKAKPSAADDSANVLLETQILMNHLKSLPRFNGLNPEVTMVFLARVKSILTSCPSLSFSKILGAIKPNMDSVVIKMLENQDISTFEKFSDVLSKNSGIYQNTYQRLDEWLVKPKKYGESMTSHHCKISSELEPIIESFKKTIIKMKKTQGFDDYKPKFEDAFQAFKICKILQSIRAECQDTFSNIIIELSTFASSEQIAQRAESLTAQNLHPSCYRADGSKIPDSKKKSTGPRKDKTENHDNNSKADGDDRQNNYSRGRGGRGRGHRGGYRGNNHRGGNRGGNRGGSRGSYANRNFRNPNGPEVTKVDSYYDRAYDDVAKVRIQSHGRVRGIPRTGPSGQGGVHHAYESQGESEQDVRATFQSEYRPLTYDHREDEYENQGEFYNYGSSSSEPGYEYANDGSYTVRKN